MTDLQVAIHALLGAAPDEIRAFGVTRFSTKSGSGNRDGWVKPGDGGVVYFGCWRQGLKGSYLEQSGGAQTLHSVKHPVQSGGEMKLRAAKRAAAQNLKTWMDALALEPASLVNHYLKRRGINLPELPSQLREASLDYYEDGKLVGAFPAMLALITNDCGEMVALHRTYLASNGTKAAVASVKKMTRTSATLAGASIKFDDPAVIQGLLTLGVAEGIETALACRLGAAIPTWSCISAFGMQQFEWPAGLQRLVIFGDNDASGVGQDAAMKLAKRAVEAGLECRVLIPKKVGYDWLDVYSGERQQ